MVIGYLSYAAPSHHMCEVTGLPHTRSLPTKHDFTFKLPQREGNCIPKMSPHSGGKSTYVDGFPSLAAFMASDRDKTAMILKRFDRLAARNLLCLQSELAEIESKLDQFDRDDQGNRETMQSLRNWEAYKARYADEPQRMQLMSRLRSTMREYSARTAVSPSLLTLSNHSLGSGEALVFESTLARIQPPDRKTLKAFRFTFFHGRPGDPQSFPVLGGHSSSVYDDEDDLLALHGTEDPDRLTLFVRDNFGFLFQVCHHIGRSQRVD